MNRAFEVPPRKLGDLCRRYEAGESISALARELSVTDKVIKRLLTEQGIEIRGTRDVYAARRGFQEADVTAIHARYMAGESSVDLAKSIGCHSSTLRNIFKRHDLAVRDGRESHLLVNARLTPEVRLARVAAAHDAVRGRTVPLDQLCRSALNRERTPPTMSEPEQRMHALLQQSGLAIQFQRACGPYNIDFAVGHSIAVECFGGGWHGSGRHAARHQKRTRYLLDAGWHVVIVWIDSRKRGGWVKAFKDAVSDLERAGRDPSAPREYRVVWSDGETASCGADVDHFTLVRPGEVSRDPASGRYYRSR